MAVHPSHLPGSGAYPRAGAGANWACPILTPGRCPQAAKSPFRPSFRKAFSRGVLPSEKRRERNLLSQYPRKGEQPDLTSSNFIRRFFFDTAGANESKLCYAKRQRNAENKDFALCGGRPGSKLGKPNLRRLPTGTQSRTRLGAAGWWVRLTPSKNQLQQADDKSDGCPAEGKADAEPEQR